MSVSEIRYTENTVIVVTYGSYKWEAIEQADRETFLIREYSGDQIVNTYAIHEDALEEAFSKVLEGSVR